MLQDSGTAGQKLQELIEIMARLRAPGGCPWDREQSFDTIKKYTVEETYEVLDAIDRRDWADLREELGDYILQAVFYAQMASEEGHFSFGDCLDAINEKLIRRHPHIFGEETAQTGDEVLKLWEAVKTEEKKSKSEKPKGLLDGIPRAQPALLEAQQISSKAARAGFDWNNSEDVIAKLHEEIAEFRAAREAGSADQMEDELGDILFTIVNLARFAKVDPEQALRRTNAKFRKALHLCRDNVSPDDGAGSRRHKHRSSGSALAGGQAVNPRPIVIEDLKTEAQFREVVHVQETIWGFSHIDLLPVRFFDVASKIGGEVFGAYDNGRMVGFCLAIPGLKPDGKPYLHSHMLGRPAGISQFRSGPPPEDASEGITRSLAASH